MRNKSRAFTLIELLVVVLIIGILATVAVPQYQKAADKARYMQAVVLADAAAKANQRYFLANGEYAHSLDELDVQIPPSSCYLANTTHDSVVCSVGIGNSRVYYEYNLRLNWRMCFGVSNSARANDVCKSVTGKKQGSTSGDYTSYRFD